MELYDSWFFVTGLSYCPHFTGEETEKQRSSTLVKVTWHRWDPNSGQLAPESLSLSDIKACLGENPKAFGEFQVWAQMSHVHPSGRRP